MLRQLPPAVPPPRSMCGFEPIAVTSTPVAAPVKPPAPPPATEPETRPGPEMMPTAEVSQEVEQTHGPVPDPDPESKPELEQAYEPDPEPEHEPEHESELDPAAEAGPRKNSLRDRVAALNANDAQVALEEAARASVLRKSSAPRALGVGYDRRGSAEAAAPNGVAVASGPEVSSGPDDDAARCYLVFDQASQGTLVGHWSRTAVPGALMCYLPAVAPPPFKLKQNSAHAPAAASPKARAQLPLSTISTHGSGESGSYGTPLSSK